MTQTAKVFDINEYLSQFGENVQTASKRKHSQKEKDFKYVVERVKRFLHEKIQDPTLTQNDKEKRHQVEHKARIGEPESRNMLLADIEEFIRTENLQNIEYPSIFPSLSRAIFEYIYGFGLFYKWNLYPYSPSAKIVGKEIWFKIDGKFIKQEEEFESVDEVMGIILLFSQSNPNFSITPHNPQGELDLADGTRVTITIPPRTLVPTIVFRRFIVSKFSFEEQAKRNTIAEDDVPLFKLLAKIPLNVVIAGHVESGKSTMLKTFYSERPKDLTAILIEGHPESYLKRDFPERLVHEFSIRDDELQKVLRTILRFDHDFVIMQEVRGIEAEAAIDGASRGATGLLMTYHVTEPSKVPEQLAQHIVDAYPNRKYVNEVRRVAQTLHLGVTMETFPGNIKRVTSVYEICYDFNTDKAWINYLIHLNPESHEWEYNGNISDSLKEYLMKKEHAKDGERLLQLLNERASLHPMSRNPIQPIVFHEGRR